MTKEEGQKLVAEVDKLHASGSFIEDACEKLGVNKGKYYFWKSRLAKENKTQVISYDGATEKAPKKQRTKSQAPIILVMGDPDQVFDFYQKAQGTK